MIFGFIAIATVVVLLLITWKLVVLVTTVPKCERFRVKWLFATWLITISVIVVMAAVASNGS